MKSKEVKYREAVIRNIRLAKREKYKGKETSVAKVMLGIRKIDPNFDSLVSKLVQV